jgi:pimeloyl-ACP methyl ester carboxylesterase
MTRFTEALAIPRYTLYMQDHGGPVGFRMALAHPERVEAVIVQDAVSHNEGLGSNWKTRHVGNDPHIDRYDPDLWTDEFAFLSQPGQIDIRTELFYNYRANVESYPKWQAWMREHQPRLLVLWGKYDPSFDSSEPEAYRRDVANAEVHVLGTGHFALDTASDQIAALVRGFMR